MNSEVARGKCWINYEGWSGDMVAASNCLYFHLFVTGEVWILGVMEVRKCVDLLLSLTLTVKIMLRLYSLDVQKTWVKISLNIWQTWFVEEVSRMKRDLTDNIINKLWWYFDVVVGDNCYILLGLRNEMWASSFDGLAKCNSLLMMCVLLPKFMSQSSQRVSGWLSCT